MSAHQVRGPSLWSDQISCRAELVSYKLPMARIRDEFVVLMLLGLNRMLDDDPDALAFLFREDDGVLGNLD